MPAWSDEGETILVSVGSAAHFDNSTPAVDCSDEEFSTIEASLYQVLHRTIANEPPRVVPNTGAEVRSVARECKEIRSEKHV